MVALERVVCVTAWCTWGVQSKGALYHALGPQPTKQNNKENDELERKEEGRMKRSQKSTEKIKRPSSDRVKTPYVTLYLHL